MRQQRNPGSAIALALMIAAWSIGGRTDVQGDEDPQTAATLKTALTNEEAWKRLPKAVQGEGSELPVWARTLAVGLPRSTAALLQLDLAQRTKSPIEPKLRAAMRWVTAHANRCAYAQAYAAADARKAGLDEGRLGALAQEDYPGWSPAEQAALRFARKMTLESDAVTDEEFAALTGHFGEKGAASMVLLSAYANFQDRLLICLGVSLEPNGPLPLVETAFEPAAFQRRTTSSTSTTSTSTSTSTGARKPEANAKPSQPTGADLVTDEPEWSALTYDILQTRLEAQRQKPTRLRIPSKEELARTLPASFFSKPTDIVWYKIVFSYAPELATPFEDYMRTAGAEVAGLYNRVFAQSLFWIVTKTIRCPYCMGHCEMNWEVAGLTKDEIADRSRKLASDDWSAFPPAEQRAYAFARLLTRTPWLLTDLDRQTLIKDHGPELARILMVSASRYNYMTRISNGFQLKLERENVFYDYYNTKPPQSQSEGAAGPIALLTDEECWKVLPTATTGGGRPLPSWAKAVATRLPRTAAAMLELDLAQRTKSPIDPVLRAKMRWVIARNNQCKYSEAYALADLKRAGGDDAAAAVLTGDPAAWPSDDRAPLLFARLLTVDAPNIPDALFAQLRKRFGDKTTAAMVLLGAYGNFQDRVILGLQLPMEPDGPLPPLDVAFAPGAFQSVPLLPESKPIPTLLPPGRGENAVDRDPLWSTLTYETLQSRLEEQRKRTPRLPIPAWEEVKKNLPPAIAARPTRIVWNLVCSGYVPELAIPWSVSTRTMWAEAKPDRVFEESLFWIQTRAIKCNYCMGHCEMLLEVAGLDKNAIAERTRKLAGDDWSAFPPAEQRAYAYARKLTKTPWQLTPADYKTLESDLGPQNAMAAFWWLCRGLYMTRVSDGFQLPLERDNVFQDFYAKPK